MHRYPKYHIIAMGVILLCTIANGCKKTLPASVDFDSGYTFIGSNQDEEINSVIQLKDGNFLAAGKTNRLENVFYDAYFVKFDRNGKIIWECIVPHQGQQNITRILETKDGLIYGAGDHVGYESGKSNSNWNDIYTVLISKTGNILWDKIVYAGKSGGNANGLYKDFCYDIATNDTLLFGAGYTDNIRLPGCGFCNVGYAYAQDLNGNISWNAGFMSNNVSVYFLCMNYTANGLYFLNKIRETNRLELVKTNTPVPVNNASFTSVGKFDYSGGYDFVTGAKWFQLTDGSYIIAVTYNTTYEIEIIHLSETGTVISAKNIDAKGFVQLNQCSVYKNKIYLAGGIKKNISEPGDFFVARLDLDGNIEFNYNQASEFSESAACAIPDDAGNILVVGTINKIATENRDLVTFKLDRKGNLIK